MNPFLRRGAVSWAALAGYPACPSRADSGFAPGSRAYANRTSELSPDKISRLHCYTSWLHTKASCLRATCAVGNLCSVIGCDNVIAKHGNAHPREALCWSNSRNQPGVRTQSHSAERDLCQQEAVVHKCVLVYNCGGLNQLEAAVDESSLQAIFKRSMH
jgi:hypothetical protein